MKILNYPHPSLLKKSVEVEEVTEDILETIDNMLETMYENHGVGLAANQVGLESSIFVMDCSEDRDEPRCFINPRVVSGNGECYFDEGCLSFPNIKIKVPRFESVVIEYMDINGTVLKKTLKGLESICAQHEIDHLQGKTFLEKVNRETRRASLKQMKKRRNNR